MFLNRKDSGGLRLFRCLLQKGVKNLVLVSAEELVFAPAFSCGLDNGKAFFHITLPNGLVLHDGNVSAVINRIHYLPLQHLPQFVQEDRAYVESELMATFTFLFSILPNSVLNQPSGLGLHGRYRSQLEWESLAKKAGLATIETVYEHYTAWQPEAHTGKRVLKLLYFNGCCFNDAQLLPPDVSERCVKLGTLSGERMLEIELHAVGAEMVFSKATTLPPLQAINDDFVKQLITLL